jgi:hypothetical protein
MFRTRDRRRENRRDAPHCVGAPLLTISLPLLSYPLSPILKDVDDTQLLELAEKEFVAAVEESKRARAERDAAQERFKRALELTQAWGAIVEQKRKATGAAIIAPPIPPPPGFADGGEPKPLYQEIAEGMLRLSDDEDGSRNLTQIVRDVVRAAGFRGLTPGEIRAHAQHIYGPTAANFPHGILGKLKAGGELKNVHGRYVSIEFLGGPNENA